MKKILIIEDDRMMMRILEQALAASGTEFFFAPDTAEGIQKAHENMPDLIILDTMIGGQSGIDVLEKIKHSPKTVKIPVVVFSAVDQEEIVAQARALGAADYIVKGSLSLEETLKRIKKHLKENPESGI